MTSYRNHSGLPLYLCVFLSSSLCSQIHPISLLHPNHKCVFTWTAHFSSNPFWFLSSLPVISHDPVDADTLGKLRKEEKEFVDPYVVFSFAGTKVSWFSHKDGPNGGRSFPLCSLHLLTDTKYFQMLPTFALRNMFRFLVNQMKAANPSTVWSVFLREEIQ